MKHLYFIRHGESEFNKASEWVGSTDSPLTEDGHSQAQKTGTELKNADIRFDIIISSPLKRALETAKYVARATGYPEDKIVVKPQISERKFGTLEGRKDIKEVTEYAANEAAIDRHDGVEKMQDLHARAEQFLEYLNSLDQYDNILVVGHVSFARALRRIINDEPRHVRGRGYNYAQIVKFI
jgi:broad specificity phosphatase PhoE